jgi:hypothetical protein
MAAYALRVRVRTDVEASLGSDILLEGSGPRAFVLGGERVDVGLPAGAPTLVVVVDGAGSRFRVMSLHPDSGFSVLPHAAPTSSTNDLVTGGISAHRALRLAVRGAVIDIAMRGSEHDNPTADVLDAHALGEQLGFVVDQPVRSVGGAAASITGPVAGGHAVPALVLPTDGDGPSLVLRSRAGVRRVFVDEAVLRKGVLIGRSRRCVLGRGFNENDGLSRVHALVAMNKDGAVGAYDLASRYGLRDVQRPARSVPYARLDDGIGCIVYGAGHLTWE